MMTLDQIRRMACGCVGPEYHQTGNPRCMVSILLAALQEHGAALLPVDPSAAVTTETLPNNAHERVLLLTNIRTSAAAGLVYGTGPTIHTPERIIERKNKALRDILAFLERDGIVGSVLRSITEDEIGSGNQASPEHSVATEQERSAEQHTHDLASDLPQATDEYHAACNICGRYWKGGVRETVLDDPRRDPVLHRLAEDGERQMTNEKKEPLGAQGATADATAGNVGVNQLSHDATKENG